MTVRELLAALEGVDGDHVVVLSIDPEGNAFREVYEVAAENNRFDERDGEVQLAELTPELEEQGYTEEDVLGAEHPMAVVLWPR